MSKKTEHKNLMARWLDGRLSAEEKKLLKDDESLDALKVVIDDIDTWKLKRMDLEAGLSSLQERTETNIPHKKVKSTQWIGIAAGFAILISSMLLWNSFKSDTISVDTGIAEKKNIELPLGSLVKLDASSKIMYNKEEWDDNRVLSLTGQAFFDISKGSPFKVTTSTATVTVLGTEFNIKAEGDGFLVHCYEGKVMISYNSEEQIIEGYESILLNQGKLIKGKHENRAPDWLSGYSRYNQTPLAEIILDLQRHYDVQIDLPKKYEKLKFSGSLQHSDLQSALKTLFTTMEIEYAMDKNKVLVY